MRKMHLKLLHLLLLSLLCAYLSSCNGSVATPSGAGSSPLPPTNPPSFTIDNWQWRNPLPQGNALYDITYVNDTYIAVGDAGTILNFSDGLEYSGVFLGIRSVAYGNGTFVAVGAGDTILTSDTGRTWTPQKPFDPEKFGYVSLAFGNNTFVATGLGNVYTSQDNGVTWRSQTLINPSLSWLGRVIYENNLFVVLSDSGAIFTSPDGRAWTQGSIPDKLLSAITYGQGKFVVESNWTGRVYTSPDALTWTLVGGINILDNINGLAYGNDRFIAVGRPGGPGVIYSSPDAVTWSKLADTFDFSLNQVTFLNGQFIAIGSAGLIVTSPDGQTWTDITSTVTNLPLLSVAYGNNLFMATAFDQYITGRHGMFSSPDGLVWSKLPLLPNDEQAYRVKYMDGLFYAFCRFSIFSSLDGLSWTKVAILPSEHINDFIYANNMLVAVGKGIATSPDGISWTEHWTGPDYITFTRVIYAKGTFVVISNFSKILISQDGIAWSDANLFFATDVFMDLAFGHDQFVVVGYHGTVYSSSDAIDWTNRVYGFNSSLTNVISTPDGFVAIGSFNADFGLGPDFHGLIQTSLDGISWTAGLLTLGDLYGVAYGQNSYVATGSAGFILQSDTVTSHPGSSSNPQNIFADFFSKRPL